VNNSDHERLFSLLGIDLSIDTTGLIVDRIQQQMSELLIEEEVGGLG
jgi:hypothetical protein